MRLVVHLPVLGLDDVALYEAEVDAEVESLSHPFAQRIVGSRTVREAVHTLVLPAE